MNWHLSGWKAWLVVVVFAIGALVVLDVILGFVGSLTWNAS